MVTDDFSVPGLDQMIDLRHPFGGAGRSAAGTDRSGTGTGLARQNRRGQVTPGSDLFGTTLEIAGIESVKPL